MTDALLDEVSCTQRRHAAVVAVAMGYGHLRAASALADALGEEVIRIDEEPAERSLWARYRWMYEVLSRGGELPLIGPALRWLLETVTAIPPLEGKSDPARPTWGCRRLARLIGKGLGRDLARRLDRQGATLLTTFYAPALAVAEHGSGPVLCVVTDVDINRVWAPLDPREGKVIYAVPARRTAERLRIYGVPDRTIRVTGFPLPQELTGDRDQAPLRRDLAARLHRLDRHGVFLARHRDEVEREIGPILERKGSDDGTADRVRLTFAIGGAGTLVGRARMLLSKLAPLVRSGALALSLVAGTRPEVVHRLRHWADEAGFGGETSGAVEVVYEPEFTDYYRRFNQVLRCTDLLWTKPSELVFYGALGVPLLLDRPVGHHELLNQEWIFEHGAGCSCRELAPLAEMLLDRLASGAFAEMAWNGFSRLPGNGTAEIIRLHRDFTSA